MQTSFNHMVASITEQAATQVATTLWGRELRRYQCDRGAATRILAHAICLPGAGGEQRGAVERAAKLGLQSATQAWSSLSPTERDRKVQGWQSSRQRDYPAADWGDDAKAAGVRLRESVQRDLTTLARVGQLATLRLKARPRG